MSVFLLQKGRGSFDLTSAHRLGQLVTVLGERDSPSLAPGPALATIRRALKEYDPRTDHLLTAGGDPLAAFMAGAVLTDTGVLREGVSWLRWDRARDLDGRRDFNRGQYEPVVFNLNGAPMRADWR